MIKNHLKNEKYINGKNFEITHNKIYDYIMEKLYDKLFPIQPSFEDSETLKNCCAHIWIDLNNLFKEDKEYILDNYIPDSINCIKQFEKEKSLRSKLLEINKLLLCIHNLLKFNGQEKEGVDDELSFLIFTIIKSKSERIYTICKYIEFLFDNKMGGSFENNLLTKL